MALKIWCFRRLTMRRWVHYFLFGNVKKNIFAGLIGQKRRLSEAAIRIIYSKRANRGPRKQELQPVLTSSAEEVANIDSVPLRQHPLLLDWSASGEKE